MTSGWRVTPRTTGPPTREATPRDILDADDPSTPVWRGYLAAFDEMLHASGDDEEAAAARRMQMIRDVAYDQAEFRPNSTRGPRKRPL